MTVPAPGFCSTELSLNRSAALKIVALCILTVAIMYWRRPDQFLHPSIWDEDGREILRAYAERGLRSFAEPVNGYFVSTSKLIGLAAFRLSFLQAPEIMLWLTVALTCAVVCAVAFSPTHLRWAALCAVAALLVPTDSEAFAVSLMSFWWAGLLLLLALSWKTDRSQLLRYMFVVVGGFSSPLILVVAPLILVRAIWERSRTELYVATVACLIAFIQAREVRAGSLLPGIDATSVSDILIGSIMLGVPVIVLLVALGASLDRRLHLSFFLLAAVAIAVSSLTLARVPISITHPMMAGPRYFFYPYIIAMWLAIWLACLSRREMCVALLSLIAFAVLCAVTWPAPFPFVGFMRHQIVLDWRADVAACASSLETYQFPVQYDGSDKVWKVPLTGEQCGIMLNKSWF